MRPIPTQAARCADTTTVPTQALGLLNGDFANGQAERLAGRLKAECPGDLSAQIRRAIRLATGAEPAADEVARDVAWIGELRARAKLDEATALVQYCLLTYSTNAFLYLD